MKKIILLSIIVLLSSCGCLLSQIPPQYIYCGEDCQGVLPDYRNKITATDNCGIVTLVQEPEAGYIIGVAGLPITVRIKAIDNSKNYKQIKFTVTLLDTIPPVIDSTGLLVDNEIERIEYLYNKADIALANKMDEFDALFPYHLYGIDKDAIDSTYYKQIMVISVAAGHAVTGFGHRLWQWQNPGDTLIIGGIY